MLAAAKQREDSEEDTRALKNTVAYLQQTHAETLAHLHERVATLAARCNDLTLQLSMAKAGGTCAILLAED